MTNIDLDVIKNMLSAKDMEIAALASEVKRLRHLLENHEETNDEVRTDSN